MFVNKMMICNYLLFTYEICGTLNPNPCQLLVKIEKE